MFSVSSPPAKQPTRTVLTTGTAATYTTPAGCKRLEYRMVGGGGGGGAATTNSGSTGGTTTFGTTTAVGGGGGTKGAFAPCYGGIGGTGGTDGAGTITRFRGAVGEGCEEHNSVYAKGSDGGASQFGGNGRGGWQTTNAPVAGAANSGSGGGGGAQTSQGVIPGAGGGAGEYVEGIIINPASSYTYTIGAGGAGGAAGVSAGEAGGSGGIIIDEYYN